MNWRGLIALWVTGTACQPNTAAPALIRLDPPELPATALPMVATLYGTNLHADANVSLDDHGAIEVSSAEVTFNGVAAPWVSYRSADELAVNLPSELSPGTYDVLLHLGPRELSLPAGLRILGDDSANIALAPTSGDEVTPAASRDSASSASREADTTTSSETTPSSSGSDSASVSSSDVSTSETFRCAPGDFGPAELVTLQGYDGRLPWSPTLTGDGMTMYFTDASSGTEQLWKATRSDRNASFVATVAESMFSTGGTGTPYIAPNGLSLYFYSTQVTGYGGGDLYVAKRLSTSATFSYPLAFGVLNSAQLDYLPWVSPDELSIAFVSTRSGASAYYTAARTATTLAFSAPRQLSSLTHSGNNGRLFISADGLRAYFTSANRAGGVGADDVWYATRAATDAEFAGITNLSGVNTLGSETEVTLSQDGEELFLILMGSSSRQLYRSLANCP